MKRETLRHPKTYDLCSRLEVDRPTALGYLQLLWDFTAEVAIAGDVGKWPDGAIARACDWNESPGKFIAALTESGWLDEHPAHRLVVHDWSHHCERWVKLKARKLGINFIGSTGLSIASSIEATIERSIDATIEGSVSRDRTNPNQTYPGPGPGRPVPEQVFEKCSELAEARHRHVQPLSAGKLRLSIFKHIDLEHLKDPHVLIDWHRRQLSADDPIIGSSEAELLLVLAAALCALSNPGTTNPVGSWIATLRNHRWKKVLPYVRQAKQQLDSVRQEAGNGAA